MCLCIDPRLFWIFKIYWKVSPKFTKFWWYIGIGLVSWFHNVDLYCLQLTCLYCFVTHCRDVKDILEPIEEPEFITYCLVIIKYHKPRGQCRQWYWVHKQCKYDLSDCTDHHSAIYHSECKTCASKVPVRDGASGMISTNIKLCDIWHGIAPGDFSLEINIYIVYAHWACPLLALFCFVMLQSHNHYFCWTNSVLLPFQIFFFFF